MLTHTIKRATPVGPIPGCVSLRLVLTVPVWPHGLSELSGVSLGLDPVRDLHRVSTVCLTILDARRDPLLREMGVTPEQVDAIRSFHAFTPDGDTMIRASSFHAQHEREHPDLAWCPLVYLGKHCPKNGGAHLDVDRKTLTFTPYGWTNAPSVRGKCFKLPVNWMPFRADAVLA